MCAKTGDRQRVSTWGMKIGTGTGVHAQTTLGTPVPVPIFETVPGFCSSRFNYLNRYEKKESQHMNTDILPASGPKLCIDHLSVKQLTPEYIAYAKQMGVECLDVYGVEASWNSYEEIVRIKRQVEDAGFQIAEMTGPHINMPESVVAGPGRDEEIKSFQQFLRNLGRAGVPATTYTWLTMGAGFQTGTTTTRGCVTRLVEEKELKKLPNLRDRVYSEEEIWGNYEYWLQRVLPVAEEARVKLQLHPNDPPIDYQGVPRLFKSRKAFRRAMEMSGHNHYSGILFCVGCWSEMFGPEGKGEDIVGAIHEFGKRGQILDVHFRNVSNHLPDFHEEFPDCGYVNMYRIMRALCEVNFTGPVVQDHVPRGIDASSTTLGDYHDRAGESFALGYIRAMIQAAQTELGRRA